MKPLRLLLVGAGALGSILCDLLRRIATVPMELTVCDNQEYEDNNQFKTSAMIRFDEDTGQPKAQTLAHRALGIGSRLLSTNYLNLNVEMLGPFAFASFDYVFVCPDSMSVRGYVWNQLCHLSPEDRPVFICGATGNDRGNSVIILPEDTVCYRCHLGSEVFRREAESGIRHNCSDTIELHPAADLSDHNVVTASAAFRVSLIMHDQFVLHFTNRLKYSEEWIYDPSVTPMIQRYLLSNELDPFCPDHTVPKMPRSLINIRDGCVFRTSLEEFRKLVTSELGSAARIQVHPHFFAERLYDVIIQESSCPCCGKRYQINRHSGRIVS